MGDKRQQVFLGTDCGATMSKVGGVWDDGTTISTKLLQRPTRSEQGTHAALAGLPYLLAERLAARPDHVLATSTDTPKQKALALRGLAQKGDALAIELFDFQARAMGFHVANLVLALDPQFVVIGGGLMDPESTSEEFRERYLQIVRDTARPHLWPVQRDRLTVVASTLGELSQAIGAALVALYRNRR